MRLAETALIGCKVNFGLGVLGLLKVTGMMNREQQHNLFMLFVLIAIKSNVGIVQEIWAVIGLTALLSSLAARITKSKWGGIALS